MQISADTVLGTRPRIPETFWNPANSISLGRIAAAPLLLVHPWFDGWVGSAVFGFSFLGVSLTDLLDGYLARRGGTITRIGKLLDPLADKLLVMTALVLLVAMPARIPLWGVSLVVAILGREMAVTGLRAMASAEGVILPAVSLGKWKTGLQTASLTCLLVHYPWFGVPLHEIGLFLLGVATVLTLWSGARYFSSYLGGREAP
jgi:CDP-diacylglycerol--glycerol-3-phosphate 3-phosphatidyltransferase